MRILAVDDDRRLCAIIKRGLLEEAYAVDLVF
jgi:DNA-binding response OmpR family regulator